ncbi:hypothetical protein PVAP13_J683348 [Panicum virgatum]|nr:hypothetical protein PVAP13_J683348 [Panicum virgatum]
MKFKSLSCASDPGTRRSRKPAPSSSRRHHPSPGPPSSSLICRVPALAHAKGLCRVPDKRLTAKLALPSQLVAVGASPPLPFRVPFETAGPRDGRVHLHRRGRSRRSRLLPSRLPPRVVASSLCLGIRRPRRPRSRCHRPCRTRDHGPTTARAAAGGHLLTCAPPRVLGHPRSSGGGVAI